MGLFDEVKQNVTVRQAAEMYGLKPNRSGLIRCIFHNDKSPSMKVDRRYYCFGCGCTGDAVDFTAQLFGIGLRDAAIKLADDFGIAYSNRGRDSPKKQTVIKKKEAIPEEKWQAEYLKCLRTYLDYKSLLLDWKEQYAPRNRYEEWDDRFITALRELTVVEYYLDTLLFGDQADKEFIVREKIQEVKNIEQKCEEYRNRGRQRSDKENEPYGKSGRLPDSQKFTEHNRKGNNQKFDGELYDCSKRRSTISREPSL